MQPPCPEIIATGEDAVLLVFGKEIDPTLTPHITAWCHAIRAELGALLTDLVPSYASIALYYDPDRCDFRGIIRLLGNVSDVVGEVSGPAKPRHVQLPVWYDPSVGPDLTALAEACSLSVPEVIEHHTAVTYQVYALGFSPGFGFMGQVDPAIASPRLARPRSTVPAGSVGIANRQTAVYPSISPGGWQLIGRCPTPLFNQQDLARLAVGDQVTFLAVDRARFRALGGDDTPFADGAPT